MVSDPALPIEIRLLGSFQVRLHNRVIQPDDWPRKKAAALLKRLAVERRLLKDQAIEFLWPDSDPASGANNLYKTLHHLRKTIDTALGPEASSATFRFEDGVLSLQPSVWVDAQELDRLCMARLSISSEAQAAEIAAVLDLFRGDLLPDDRYEEWTLIPRERLYRCWRETSLALAEYRGDRQDTAGAIALLIPLLERDRADEPVHRELMRLYVQSGQRHEALRQYQACVEALAAEIDAPPSKETTALYEQILQGELDPVPASLPAPASFPEDQARPIFVGRERELNLLQTHLEAVVAGEGRILFITGEAGQGKTSLMAEFAHRSLAAYPDLAIAAGSCQALTGMADPYLPFRDLIAMLNGDWQRPWLGGEVPAGLARRLRALSPYTAQTVATAAPDLAGVLVPPAGQRLRPEMRNQSLYQGQIFEQMGQLLRVLAGRQPLVLVLDDLQWIDSASAGLLFYLGRQLANSPVLILGAYRPSDVNRGAQGDHPLALVVQELTRYRGEIRIDLEAAGLAEERSFVDALIDSEPNRLDVSFREMLYRRTRGNPLFTIELLRAMQNQGDLRQDAARRWTAAGDLDWGILPARVEAVIARRIEALPGDLHHLLSAASVEGESFSVEVLAAVLGRNVPEVLRELSEELDHRHRLVREQGEWRLGQKSFTRYQFRHNLFQQYLYQQLSAGERRAFHEEIAGVLEQAGGEVEPLVVSLAHHYLAAGSSEKAVLYLCRAGEVARRRVALEEAVQFFEAALEHWQDGDPAARAEVLYQLGESLLTLGRAEEARHRFSQAERLYAQAGNRTRQGAMHRLIGRSHWEQGERAQALEGYHRALALLEQEPQGEELARAVSAVSQMHMLADEFDEAIAWGVRALDLGQALETEDVIIHASVNVGASWVAKGEVERGLAMITESHQRAEALNLPHDACRAYAALGDALVSLERYPEAVRIYERMLAYSQKIHATLFEGVALVQLANLDWWGGRWRSALLRRQAIEEWANTSTGPSMAKVWAANFLGLSYNDLGQPEKACLSLASATAVARSAHELQTTVPHLCQLARCAESQADAAALVQEIFSLIDATSYPRYEVLPALRLSCSWLAQNTGGDPASLSRLEKARQKMQNQQSTAILDEVQAYAAGLRGEWKMAVGYYDKAAGHWEALKRPYDLLRTLGGWLKAFPPVQKSGVHTTRQEIQSKAGSLIERLAGELDEPEVRQAFLASPLVENIRMNLVVD